MIAYVKPTGETLSGDLWTDGLFHADDGRQWMEHEVEILET